MGEGLRREGVLGIGVSQASWVGKVGLLLPLFSPTPPTEEQGQTPQHWHHASLLLCPAPLLSTPREKESRTSSQDPMGMHAPRDRLSLLAQQQTQPPEGLMLLGGGGCRGTLLDDVCPHLLKPVFYCLCFYYCLKFSPFASAHPDPPPHSLRQSPALHQSFLGTLWAA